MSGVKDYTIQAYIGYTDDHITVVRGRVLDDPAVVATQSDSWWTNLRNSFRRFISSKVTYQELLLTVGDRQYTTKTDDEGYFTFKIQHSLLHSTERIPELKLNIPCQPMVSAKVIKIDSDYIVVSDIDDTIIETHVSSVLKLKLLFNTIFRNQYQRTSIEGMAQVYQHLKREYLANFFYISKSPYNLYTYIVDFLEYNKYPLGSIILRDFGWHLLSKKKSFGEKYDALDQLYQQFPSKKFILVGDAAEKDADIYADLAKKHPGQTIGIFIRKVGKTENLIRIQDEVMQASETPLYIFDTSESLKSALEVVMKR